MREHGTAIKGEELGVRSLGEEADVGVVHGSAHDLCCHKAIDDGGVLRLQSR